MSYLLVLNKPDADVDRALVGIAAAARLELVTTKTIAAALGWLEAKNPRVVVFNAEVPRAEKLCQRVRSSRALANVPLIALVSDTSNSFVERLYGMGCDDVISTALGPSFISRVRNLPDSVATAPERGMAVVADPERERCNVLGRVLSNAGYDVKFAHDDVALSYYTQNHKPRVVVASANLGPPRQLITAARRRGCTAPWIVAARRRDLVKHANALAGLERVSVVAATSAPETILFASNELMRGELPPTRAHERYLYGTVVWFRAAGEEFDDLGFSYNVSVGGLFVRTLAPPDRDNVWLELRPPRSLERIRLEGRVTWRRAYVPTSAATGPPGFGVSVTGALGEGVALWGAQCESFGDSARASLSNVAKLHAARREDARTSGEYMLLEVPSESRLAVVRVVSDASTEPPPPPSTPPVTDEAVSALAPLPPPPNVVEEPEQPIPLVAPSSRRREPSEPPIPLVKSSRASGTNESSSPEAAAIPPAPPVPIDLTDYAVKLPTVPPPPPPSARHGNGVAHSVHVPPRRRRVLTAPVVGYVLLGIVAGAIAANYVLEEPARPLRKPTTPALRASVEVAPLPPSVFAPPSVVSAPEPVLSAEPAASVPPIVATLHPIVPDAAPSAVAEPAPASVDGADLPAIDGYLLVRSPEPADVYTMGFKIGVVNEPNRSRCGLRWVRLGRGDPPSWVSRGLTIDVKCQSVTTIDLAPGPFEEE
jgi:DNA-binding response OmpR family regulator